MKSFADAKLAWDILNEAFGRIDPAFLANLNMTYAYYFTDLDWHCTVILHDGQLRLAEGLLPEVETTLEMSSAVFHKVMTGKMNVIYAHLSNKVRIAGSMGNVLKLRTVVRPLSEAYRTVLAEKNLAEDDGEGEAEHPTPGE
jgi:putative sterol carrier protein